jgi:hypothetical protein
VDISLPEDGDKACLRNVVKFRISYSEHCSSQKIKEAGIMCDRYEPKLNLKLQPFGNYTVQSCWSRPTFHIRVLPPSSGRLSAWWWRQHAPLKLRSTSTRLYGTISQNVVIFNLAAMITCISQNEVRPITLNAGHQYQISSESIQQFRWPNTRINWHTVSSYEFKYYLFCKLLYIPIV